MEEKKYRIHEEFELSPLTMAIIPVPYGSKIYSKILEMDDELLSPFRPFDIIKKSCRFYASSFSGRKEGTKALIGVTHKAPIVIDPIQSIYFFPTASPSKPDCAWISLEHVDSYRKAERNMTEVTFRNRKTYTFPLSINSFENQLLRTALLRSKMLQRSTEYDRMRFFPAKAAMEENRDYWVRKA